MFTLAYILHLVLCGSVSSGISSATNTKCSPRWIVHPQSRGWGAARSGATTPRGCLDACVANASCRTAEWVYVTDLSPGAARCWIYKREPSRQNREYHALIVQFDIVRQCYTTSGRLHDLIACFSAKCYAVNSTKSPHFYRAMLCLRGTSHGPVSVSVCLSQVGVLLKRLNVGSHKQHHTIAQGL